MVYCFCDPKSEIWVMWAFDMIFVILCWVIRMMWLLQPLRRGFWSEPTFQNRKIIWFFQSKNSMKLKNSHQYTKACREYKYLYGSNEINMIMLVGMDGWSAAFCNENLNFNQPLLMHLVEFFHLMYSLTTNSTAINTSLLWHFFLCNLKEF